MEWTPYVTSAVVLLVSLIAYMRASAALREAEAARGEVQRRTGLVEEALRGEIDGVRKMLGKVAAGEPMTQEMIEDGQLWRDVDPRDALRLVEADPRTFVLDVRTPGETAGGVIAGAVLIPMDEIEERRAELPTDGRPMLVYCAMGGRSAAVCDHLARQGYDNLHNLTGGFGAWPGPKERPGA